MAMRKRPKLRKENECIWPLNPKSLSYLCLHIHTFLKQHIKNLSLKCTRVLKTVVQSQQIMAHWPNLACHLFYWL